MHDGEVVLGHYPHITVLGRAIGEEVEDLNHGAVAGVLDGDDAVGGFAGLDGGEDRGEGWVWVDSELCWRGLFGEVLESCLVGSRRRVGRGRRL